MPLEKHKRNENGTYGPAFVNREDVEEEKREHYYLSKEDHRKTASPKKGKTRWDIEEGQEFSVFLEAIQPYWLCEENNCLFSLIDKGKYVLGENGERIAKFPNERNEHEPWHGYPVSTDQSQNRPSSELLDIIQDSGFLDLKVRIKIEKGNI